MFMNQRIIAIATTVALWADAVLGQDAITINIDPARAVTPISKYRTGACIEDVNHEIYGGLYSQMIFGESFQEPAAKDDARAMWKIFHDGSAQGTATLETQPPFVGKQSQRLTFQTGTGVVGLENRGLNRQGLSLLAQHPYEGHLWARAEKPTTMDVSFASADGSHIYATTNLTIADTNWRRYDFALTPDTTDSAARFQMSLSAPGSVALGYVFLQPGPWGTFKGLPVRRDVAEALIEEGITAMRYGGSMVNTDRYRWKKMIGDRDRRPPYHGVWYACSTNGWGIPDFLNFCEAAGFLAVPDFNINESPADMADFIEYANGPASSTWGAKRAADGHPAPYHLTHIELGNEERVDETYNQKFESLARAIWTKDPHIILTVGDFAYTQPIVDPFHLDGADSHITTLAAHQKILQLAKQFDAEVWFDIHVWTDAPTADATTKRPFLTYIDAIDKLAAGAKHHVVVFELNANNHQQRRALANAQVMLDIQRDGRIPFVSSANCLQIDHQNDNGWDQGLLFLNPTQVWLQPPGYVWQMLSCNYNPLLATCTIQGENKSFQAIATTSVDHKTIVLQAVNAGNSPITATIQITSTPLSDFTATAQTLAAAPNAANTARDPQSVHPINLPTSSNTQYTFPPSSFTIIRWTR
jgi:alpha-L-arabinofuranosidase